MSDFAPERGADGRERPRYGEYATPEEQRARIQVPDVTFALETGASPESATASAPVVAPATAVEPTVRRPRVADRIATAMLLAFGLFNVVTSAPRLFDYDAYLDFFLGYLGVEGALADPGSGAGWGAAAAFVLIVGWLLTALVSWRSLRAGHLTFWIPLVAGIVFNITSAIFMIVPIMNDPVLWSALQSALIG